MTDILDRLAHPELEAGRHRPDRLFLVRNVLNVIFILMAVVAMVGIAVSWSNGSDRTWCYVLGLVAVGVKMVEALLRMPAMLRRPQRRQQTHVRRLSEQMAAMKVEQPKAPAETAEAPEETPAAKQD